MEKTFLLGVGCQKGGTSWLYTYLSRHPEADFKFGKEYHVLDYLNVPEMAFFLEQAQRRLAVLEKKQVAPDNKEMVFLKSRIAFCASPDMYLDHFADMAARRPEVNVVGDITPSYAALPTQAFRWVSQGMAQRGTRTRVVFLMRDPVERVISHFRMARKMGPAQFADRPDDDAIAAFSRTHDVEIRTRYEATLQTLDAAFTGDEVLVLFYEELFRQDTISTVCAHLGVADFAADFQKVNESTLPVDISQTQREAIARHYADTYAFAADRFGSARISSIWKSYAMLT